MVRRRTISAGFLCASLLCVLQILFAQSAGTGEAFRARLSPVPINVGMMATVAGSGSLKATLKGNQLTIEGSFEGLRSPATTALIHRGPKGIPGPVVPGMELTVT